MNREETKKAFVERYGEQGTFVFHAPGRVNLIGEYKYAPLILNNEKLVIANTNKRRGLSDSKYNERRKECEKALENLQAELAISCLCDLSRSCTKL